jgi:similar to spore coat protein
MGLLDMLSGGENALTECDIAADMLKDSKYAVRLLAEAVTEVGHAELRQLLFKRLNAAVDHHYQLADLVMKKEWYKPYLVPEQIAPDVQLFRATRR